ncbi:hypothetical protein A1OK_17440 [Enterovibrio norvegicus FF-454]|uniref:G domain-containing protein n=1 Tax=Enterovibrio norvegicus FF-454 TaxID=1185651 RepID=A0A1E5BW03_9GAMM|nr:hypothetical protein [Enterovibrio norvegicus]OEE57409.1 hypothetical protein A1OK_17440 [Enterovibrio norvegicus FF-454]
MQNSTAFSRQLAMDISHSSLLDEFKKAALQLRLHQLEAQPLNILFAGPQGVGKTSTIKALFGGALLEPSSSDAGRYEMGNLVVWDYPGHTGNPEQDAMLDMQLAATLTERDSNGNPLIDMVVVVLDAAERNLNSGYRLITEVLVPALGDKLDSRLVVGLNKVDAASYGYEWDYVVDSPSTEVEIWPESTATLLRHCMLDETGLEIAPVCYAAEFARRDEAARPFNLLKLMNQMVVKLPLEKKLTLIDAPLNAQTQAWYESDDRNNYLTEMENNLFDLVYEGAKDGARFGGLLGAYLGKQGRELGYLVRRNLRRTLHQE